MVNQANDCRGRQLDWLDVKEPAQAGPIPMPTEAHIRGELDRAAKVVDPRTSPNGVETHE